MRISKNSEDVLLFATVSHRNNLRVLLVRVAAPLSISPTRIPSGHQRKETSAQTYPEKREDPHDAIYAAAARTRSTRRINPSFVVTHRASIDQALDMYRAFQEKKDHCIKVIMDPWAYGAKAA